MIESMARTAGTRTGLFTSPHLVRFAERIRIDGASLPDVSLASSLEAALAIGVDLSFFETTTLAAFLAFREAGVDLAVLEVGIGGRLDATNVVPAPRCAAITRVALDHQDMLGDTLEAIAREKAAIAKAGAPIVIGSMAPEARAAAIEVATVRGARIVDVAEVPAHVSLGLAGPHQRENAGTAWTVARELGITEDARASGLASVRWPGRLERIDVAEGDLEGPWILDGAHNPDGAAALVSALANASIGAVVFGALADKSWREMLAVVRGIAAPRVYVAPGGRAPAPLEALATLAEGTSAASVGEGLRMARRMASTKVVVVCGSLYLVGDARAQLLRLPRDPVVAL